MARTPAVSVLYDICVLNLVSLVFNPWYRAILSFWVMIPSFLWFGWLLLFDVDPTDFKTFNADFIIVTKSRYLPLFIYLLRVGTSGVATWFDYLTSGQDTSSDSVHLSHTSSNTGTYASLHTSPVSRDVANFDLLIIVWSNCWGSGCVFLKVQEFGI